MTKKMRPQSKKQNLVVQEVDCELLIYDLERNKAVCLNETSALVWQACDGKRTVAQIKDLLGKQLNAQTNEDIVWLALDQLSKEKLIDPPLRLGSKYENMSRRDVVRRIAVGSAVALPVVAGLVAPPAYAQVSICLGNTCVCNSTLWMAGEICVTTTPCAVISPACSVCHADVQGMDVMGTCAVT